MNAIAAALSQIDRVAADGDLAPDPAAPLELETAGEPIVLPDGKRIYPPSLLPGPAALAGNERPPGGRRQPRHPPSQRRRHRTQLPQPFSLCKEPAQEHNLALASPTSMPGDPELV
jgi:hypothetical protein